MGSTLDPETVLAYVAANVRRIREKRGLTQEQLAERCELHFTYVQRVEAGSANPSVRVLAKLAQALEVAPGVFFRRADPVHRGLGRPRRRKE